MWPHNMGTTSAKVDLCTVSMPYCRQMELWLNNRKMFNIKMIMNRKMSKTSIIV